MIPVCLRVTFQERTLTCSAVAITDESTEFDFPNHLVARTPCDLVWFWRPIPNLNPNLRSLGIALPSQGLVCRFTCNGPLTDPKLAG